MNRRYKPLICCLILLAVFFLPLSVRAVSPSTVSISTIPENPAPSESTTITVASYGSNLDSVLIAWFVDGKKVSSGIGQKSFTTAAPSAGSETNVRAVITLPDGDIEKKVALRPSVMVLLWQALDSHVPPFYKGKALPTTDSAIKVVAMPEIRNQAGTASPKTMIYSWQRNYTNDAEASGYGKNSFTYTNDYLENSDTIGVTASTIDGQSTAQTTVTVGTVRPQISFYIKDSVLGILWERALPENGYKISGKQTLAAEPYFFSPKETWSPSLLWNWFINDTPTVEGSKKNEIPLDVQTGVSGVSRLRLEISNRDQILETARKEINIEY